MVAKLYARGRLWTLTPMLVKNWLGGIVISAEQEHLDP